jgi:hypothetical protein
MVEGRYQNSLMAFLYIRGLPKALNGVKVFYHYENFCPQSTSCASAGNFNDWDCPKLNFALPDWIGVQNARQRTREYLGLPVLANVVTYLGDGANFDILPVVDILNETLIQNDNLYYVFAVIPEILKQSNMCNHPRVRILGTILDTNTKECIINSSDAILDASRFGHRNGIRLLEAWSLGCQVISFFPQINCTDVTWKKYNNGERYVDQHVCMLSHGYEGVLLKYNDSDTLFNILMNVKQVKYSPLQRKENSQATVIEQLKLLFSD